MTTTILSFGRIASITGSTSFVMDSVVDIDQLRIMLHSLYPELATLKYAIALNKEIVVGNEAIPQGATIALLPPFSGG